MLPMWSFRHPACAALLLIAWFHTAALPEPASAQAKCSIATSPECRFIPACKQIPHETARTCACIWTIVQNRVPQAQHELVVELTESLVLRSGGESAANRVAEKAKALGFADFQPRLTKLLEDTVPFCAMQATMPTRTP